MKDPTLVDAVTASSIEVDAVTAPLVDAVAALSSFDHLGKTLFAAVEDAVAVGAVDTTVPELFGMTVVANAVVATAGKVSPSAAPGVFLPHSRPHLVCRKYYQSVAKFLVPDWCRLWRKLARQAIHRLAGRYDNPMPESTIFSCQGLGFGF
jgi:hypothetical protein